MHRLELAPNGQRPTKDEGERIAAALSFLHEDQNTNVLIVVTSHSSDHNGFVLCKNETFIPISLVSFLTSYQIAHY